MHIFLKPDQRRALRSQPLESDDRFDEHHKTASQDIGNFQQGNLSPAAIIQLQRTIGNQAVMRLLKPTIQRGNKSGKSKKKKGDSFNDLPSDAIAISPNGFYLTVPGGLEGLLTGKDILAFTMDDKPCGRIYLSGVSQKGDYIRYFHIENEIKIGGQTPPGASYIVAWYLCRETENDYFEIGSVANEDLRRRMTGLGMVEDNLTDLRGNAESVYAGALRILLSFNWILRNE